MLLLQSFPSAPVPLPGPAMQQTLFGSGLGWLPLGCPQASRVVVGLLRARGVESRWLGEWAGRAGQRKQPQCQSVCGGGESREENPDLPSPLTSSASAAQPGLLLMRLSIGEALPEAWTSRLALSSRGRGRGRMERRRWWSV